MVIGEQPVFRRKLNKHGKPVGKAVLTGFTLDFNTPLGAAAVSNPGNYELDTVTTRKVKKTIDRVLHPIKNFTVTYTPASDSVTLELAGHQSFPTGGQITVLPGVTGDSGSVLDRDHGVHDHAGREEDRADVNARAGTSSSAMTRGQGHLLDRPQDALGRASPGKRLGGGDSRVIAAQSPLLLQPMDFAQVMDHLLHLGRTQPRPVPLALAPLVIERRLGQVDVNQPAVRRLETNSV